MATIAAQDVHGLVERLRDLSDGPRAFFEVVARGTAAVPFLEGLLRGPSTTVFQPRRLAAEALGAIGGPAGVEALLGALADSVGRRLDPQLRFAEDAVIDAIARQLARFPTQRVDEALRAALEEHPYPACALALGRHGDLQALPLLVEALHDDFARPSAQTALLGLGPAAVESLARALRSPRMRHGREGPSRIAGRAAAAALLGELSGAGATSALVEALSDPEREVRQAAAVALSTRQTTPSPDVIDVLVETLGEEEWTRAEAPARVLLALGPPAVARLLAVITRGHSTPEERRRRIRATELLARLAPTDSLAALGALAGDRDVELRRATVTALARAGAAATPALARFLDDADEGIRGLAAGGVEGWSRAPSPGDAQMRALLGRPGCPVCSEGHAAEEKYFFWLLNETHTDPGVLGEIASAGGFCREHGAELVRLRAYGEITYIHASVARRARRLLSGARSSSLFPRSPQVVGQPCPGCAARTSVERITLGALDPLLGSVGGELYGKPGLLCFSHLQMLAVQARRRTLEHLLARHRDVLARIASADALPLLAGPERRLRPAPAPVPGIEPPRDQVAELVAALAVPQACPVCQELDRIQGEWLAWLQHAAEEEAGDLEDVLPTCSDHLWALLRLGSAPLIGSAATHALSESRSRVELGLKLLAGANRSPGWSPRRLLVRPGRWAAARAALVRPVPCPLCHRQSTAVERALRLLLALLEEPLHRELYRRGHGLCVRHFDSALALAPPRDVRAFLVESLSAKVAVLEWELEEAIRKNAWSARPEAPGNEQTAWLRALNRFSGAISGQVDGKAR